MNLKEMTKMFNEFKEEMYSQQSEFKQDINRQLHSKEIQKH
jgi:hypothetical protein